MAVRRGQVGCERKKAHIFCCICAVLSVGQCIGLTEVPVEIRSVTLKTADTGAVIFACKLEIMASMFGNSYIGPRTLALFRGPGVLGSFWGYVGLVPKYPQKDHSAPLLNF